MPGKKSSRSGETASEKSWELQEIQQLIDLLIEREIAEFEMEKDGMRIRIMRQASGGMTAVQNAPQDSNSGSLSRPAEPAATIQPPQAPAAQEPAPETPAENLHVLKSPMVGTFFAAAAPDAPPFVNVGDAVVVGQVLCIVEAMKLMNEIESEFTGEIVRIHVENGQPVEYGQPLYTIKPS